MLPRPLGVFKSGAVGLMNNLLTAPCFRVVLNNRLIDCSLPQIYEALTADKVDCFPGLRAHQAPAWHMFLVQLGALAMHQAELSEPPDSAAEWEEIIGALTRDRFPGDEPWQLVVADETKPAFLQPPVPADAKLGKDVATPDALDMVITSRNHDLKQAVALDAAVDDWIFALVSLQTCEGFGGRGNYGICRMNGGSSSRVFMGLAPILDGRTKIRLGVHFNRDLLRLLESRNELFKAFPLDFPERDGLGLTWTAPWNGATQLDLKNLDIWFIEICRRVRLHENNGSITAKSGTSEAERIAAKHLNGRVGDPWAPINEKEGKALTIGDEGSFDYRRVVQLISSEDWRKPVLASLGASEVDPYKSYCLMLSAFARGNSKTGGFKQRIIPLDGRTARAIGYQPKQLHDLAQVQISDIKGVDAALRAAIALASAKGDRDKISKDNRARANPYSKRLDSVADRLFFPALWEQFAAVEDKDEARRQSVRLVLIKALIQSANDLLDEALVDLPLASIQRPRAGARAHQDFYKKLRIAFKDVGGVFNQTEEVADVA